MYYNRIAGGWSQRGMVAVFSLLSAADTQEQSPVMTPGTWDEGKKLNDK